MVLFFPIDNVYSLSYNGDKQNTLKEIIKMKKARVGLYLSQTVKKELDKQCQIVGMDMSNYFAYLILREKERTENANRMEKMFTQMFPNGVSDIGELAKLMKEVDKGDD